MKRPTRRGPRVVRHRTDRVSRQPSERSALDTLTGLTLWLTVLNGTAGTGNGVFIAGIAL